MARTGADIFSQLFRAPDFSGLGVFGAGLGRSIAGGRRQDARERDILLKRAQEVGFNSIEEMERGLETQRATDEADFMATPQGVGLSTLNTANMLRGQDLFGQAVADIRGPAGTTVSFEEGEVGIAGGYQEDEIPLDIQAQIPSSPKTKRLMAMLSEFRDADLQSGDFRTSRLQALSKYDPQAFTQAMFPKADSKAQQGLAKQMAMSGFYNNRGDYFRSIEEVRKLGELENRTPEQELQLQAAQKQLASTKGKMLESKALAVGTGIAAELLRVEDPGLRANRAEDTHFKQMSQFSQGSGERIAKLVQISRKNLDAAGTTASIRAIETHGQTLRDKDIIDRAIDADASAQRALIIAFNKLLEPSSAVMQGEAEASASSGLLGTLNKLVEVKKLALNEDGSIRKVLSKLSPTDVRNLVNNARDLTQNASSAARKKIGREQHFLNNQIQTVNPSAAIYDLGMTMFGRPSKDWVPQTKEPEAQGDGLRGNNISPAEELDSSTLNSQSATDPFPTERRVLPSVMQDASIGVWKGGSGKKWIRAQKDGKTFLYQDDPEKLKGKSPYWFELDSSPVATPQGTTTKTAPRKVGRFTVTEE